MEFFKEEDFFEFGSGVNTFVVNYGHWGNGISKVNIRKQVNGVPTTGFTIFKEEVDSLKAILVSFKDADFTEDFSFTPLKGDKTLNDSSEIRVTKNKFEKIDIRVFYDKEGELLPSKKGVSFPVELLEEFIIGLSNI